MSRRQHCRHPIDVPEDVGALRRAVAHLATPGSVRPGEAELVATELGTNLLRHAAPGGYVLYRQTAHGIEFLSVDSGPGMAPHRPSGAAATPVRPASGGLSAGLAGIRRMSAEYDCYSSSTGTVVLARLGGTRAPNGRWRHGGVNTPLGGAGPSGDAWAVTGQERLAVLVVDGLGHGEEAAVAAGAAVKSFEQRAVTDPAAVLPRANEAMRGTRGGVAGACVIDPVAGRLTFAGVGNIAGAVVRGDDKQHLVSHPGTLGTQLSVPNFRTRHYRWSPGATMIMSSDGIRAGWTLSDYPGLTRRDPAVVAAVLHRDFARATDDATVLVVQDLS
ncbi:MAG: SpoIIE family protein phosphatase [Mycobacterium sp.]|nr:SpoIIE family protein phosphatase [Mycobacterium sp.]